MKPVQILILCHALFLGGAALGPLPIRFMAGNGCAVAQEVHAPSTVSREAQRFLNSLPGPDAAPAAPNADDQQGWESLNRQYEAGFRPANDAVRRQYRPSLATRTLGGTRVLDIKPQTWQDNGRALVYLHGGAYVLSSAKATLPNTVPLAHETGLRIFAVDYSKAPQAKWPQVTDEVAAVVKALQEEGYGARDIAIYGDSAGGALAAGAVLKMRDQGLEMPAAVVMWSPWSDITETGDSYVTLKRAEPMYLYHKHLKPAADAYADPQDQKHPYVSPVYGDYAQGFPPTLIQGGTKEIFLSNFVRHYQALDTAGQTVKLDLYEGMPHVFQFQHHLPEAKRARAKMARFLERHWPGKPAESSGGDRTLSK